MVPKCVIYLVILFVGVHCGSLGTIRGRIEETLQNASDIAPDAFISFGSQAQVGQFPWMVALMLTNETASKFHCAGSLISKRHVLTAAHCVTRNPRYNLTIQLGEYDLTSYPMDCVQGRCTKNIIMHPDKIMEHAQYNPTTVDNDIALLRLRKYAPVGGAIQVIALPTFDIDDLRYDGVDVTVAGWGTTESQGISTFLRTTELNLMAHERCLEQDPDVPRGHLCAGDRNGRDTCSGDSGGPLMMRFQNKYYVSGVVSYGPGGACGKNVIGYYTNVFKYMKWINTNMKD